jgi:phosphomannomutase
MSTEIEITELAAESGARFGTSGVRGPVAALTDRVCYAYVLAFLQHLQQARQLPPGGRVAVAGDLRPSTDRILHATMRAISDRGYEPTHCGKIPSPALALYGIQEQIPTVMVTGSHIPADRNGIKFTLPAGEILKEDERSIVSQRVSLPSDFDEVGALVSAASGPSTPEISTAAERYIRRYTDAFRPDLLSGRRLGVYEHSAVGRDLLSDLFTGLGAEVVRLGRSDTFVPVDTEAIRPEDVALAAQWAEEQRLDAIVSTDGDSDRPLVSDERGRWLRGDVAGILCARFLRANVVVTPVSCNTAVERCGWFSEVRRTRIGSPFVIAEMQAAASEGARPVVGYEANGGFLTATDIELGGGTLAALPTRDPVIVLLSILAQATEQRCTVSELCADLPARHTASDRLQDFPTDRSQSKLAELARATHRRLEEELGGILGTVSETNSVDGLRITFDSGEILHLRASGNAPELRCYAEADSEARAREITALALEQMQRWR